MTDTINMAEAYRAGRGVNFRDADGRVMPAHLVKGPNALGKYLWCIMAEHRVYVDGQLWLSGEKWWFAADGTWHDRDARLILADPDPRAEADALRKRVLTVLLPSILHGDEEHRSWLTEALTAFVHGEQIPSPRGGGEKDALRKRVAELEEALETTLNFIENTVGWETKGE